MLLKAIGLQPLQINLQFLAYILPLLALPALLRVKQPERARIRGIPLILVAIFLFALLVRLFPYAHSAIPLGYDAGIYKYTIELYSNALPGIPESSLPDWVRNIFLQGLPVLTDLLHMFPGLDATQIIQILFPCLGALLILPLFTLTRKLFGERAGLIASVLYAVSYTQYSTFTFLYLKNVLGLFFLLLALYALEEKKYALLALMYAGLGIFHRPEFLLFSLILIPYFIIRRDKRLLLSAVGTALLMLPFLLPRLDTHLLMISGVLGTSGTFFDFGQYQQVSMAYLPLAFAGFLYLVIKKKWNSLFFYFIINLAIVIFQIMFFKRYIIPLDIILVILAAVGLDYTLLNTKGIAKVAAIIVAILLVVSSGMLTIRSAAETSSPINQNQLEAIQWISENTEEDARVIATSYDAPWVLGWSNRKVVAPGLFQWSEHNEAQWTRFLKTRDLTTTRGFLDEYGDPIYIYYSRNPDNYLGLEKFNNQYFKVVYNGEAIVYRYLRSGG